MRAFSLRGWYHILIPPTAQRKQINVGCMMDYMRYTPRTLTELLDANPMPEIARDRKDGSAVESAEQQNKRERTWDLNEGYTAEKTE